MAKKSGSLFPQKDFLLVVITLFALLVAFMAVINLPNKLKDTSKETPSDAAGKPVATTASISTVEANPQLGSYLHFNYVLPKGVKEAPTGSGTQARIQVMCTQPVPFDYTDSNGVTHTQTDPIVYGEAGNAIDMKAGSIGLLLGGGGSVWLWHGGSAQCVATLYQWLYNGSQTFNPFATVSFTAAGKTQ